MSKQYKPGQHVYRLPPCPAYDVAGTENWLAELAEEGLFLTEDGFFAGVAFFEYREPQKAEYRLEAAQKSTSMWADDGGEPDPEQVELSRKYAWEYVAKRRDFYIYRSLDPSARELNTDPAVQALALNAVKKRQRSAMLTSVFFLLIYPLLLTRCCPVMAAIASGTGWTALALLLAALLIADEVRAFVHLKKLQQSLTDDGYYTAESDWRKRKIPYFAGKVVKAVLTVVLLCAILRNWGVSITNADKIPLRDYTGEIPFATMRDFAGDGEYTETMTGMRMGFNTLEEKADWLAPRCISFNEEACIQRPDGSTLDGGLYVNYYELRSPTLAKLLAKELYRYDKRQKGIDPLEAPALAADEVIAYRSSLHFPTVILRRGNVVVRAYFYQTSAYKMPLETWASILFDSIVG